MEKEFKGYYRKKGNSNNQLFETSVTAENVEQATEYIKSDLEDKYTLVKVVTA